MACSTPMVQEGEHRVPERKFAHYTPTPAEIFASFTYYVLSAQDGESFGTMPTDLSDIAGGIKAALKNVPELEPLIDARGELVFEAREKLAALEKDQVITKTEEGYEFGEHQKHTDTMVSLPTLMFTAEGIEVLRSAAKTAKEFWQNSSQSEADTEKK